MIFSFQRFLSFDSAARRGALELSDPALGDLVDRHRIDEVQLLAALALGGDEVGLLQDAPDASSRPDASSPTPGTSSPSVWPFSAWSRSSSSRRLASARARKTASSFMLLICNQMVACQGQDVTRIGDARVSAANTSRTSRGTPMKFIVDLLINGPERLSAWFAWLPPLFARIVVGWVFLWSGWGKLNALDRITQNFVEWGIPFPHIMTPFVSGVEFFGGLLLLLGLFTRVAAVPLVITMIVAILSAKLGDVRFAGDAARLRGGRLHGAVWLACRGRARADLARLAVAALARPAGLALRRWSSCQKKSPAFCAGPKARGGSVGRKQLEFRGERRALDGQTLPPAPRRGCSARNKDEEESKPLITCFAESSVSQETKMPPSREAEGQVSGRVRGDGDGGLSGRERNT